MKTKEKITYKELEGTSWLRLLEMKVESNTSKSNDVALTMQFFTDLRIYGLDEAIAYVEGYERDGYFQVGITDELKKIREQIIENLKEPMKVKSKYVLDDYKMEELYNRFMNIENELPRISRDKDVNVDEAWVEKFAEVARVPIEVAYVWAVNEWIPEVITSDVKAKAKELQESGKVVVDI